MSLDLTQLTDKQKRKLAKLSKLIQEGDLAVLEHLFELEEQLDETLKEVENKIEKIKKEALPNIKDIVEQIKGKDGYTPQKGIDYIDGYTPVKGVDYQDGKDYRLTEADKREIATKVDVPEKVIEKVEVIREIPVVKETVRETISTDTGENIVEKINDLTLEPQNQIDFSHIKNVPSSSGQGSGRAGWGAHPLRIEDDGVLIDKVARILNFTGGTLTRSPSGVITIPLGSTGGGIGYTVETPSGSVNSSNVTFTVTATPVYIVSDSGTYVENNGYTLSGLTVTMSIPPSDFIRSFY